MVDITLGAKPEPLTLELVRDADFWTEIINDDGPWADGASLEIRIGELVWSATLSTDTATFNVDKADVNDAISSGETVASVFYVEGDVDLCWYRGEVDIS